MRGETSTDLARLVARTRYVLLDFDGPICALYAGHPAGAVATAVRRVLTDRGVAVPGRVADEPDPLEVLRFTASLGRPDLTRSVEEILRAQEHVAIRSAASTRYAREVVAAAHRTGRRVAVVSNNSAEAIRAYLADRGLARDIGPIIGRRYADPTRMKPRPEPVLAALSQLGAPPEACVLVGDSDTDVEAAHVAGVAAVGYANKPHKYQRLVKAEAIIDSMAALAIALAAGEPRLCRA